MNRAIETAKSIGMYSTTEPMDMSESIIGVSLIIVLVALIIVVLAVYLVQSPLYFQTL
jgi:hypothetical protein